LNFLNLDEYEKYEARSRVYLLQHRLKRIFQNPSKKTQPPAELKLWVEVLRSKKTGYKFLRQKPMRNFILDFYCSKLLLAIEADGDSHVDKEEEDQKRTESLSRVGIKVIRYTNEEILTNIVGVGEDIVERLEERWKELYL